MFKIYLLVLGHPNVSALQCEKLSVTNFFETEKKMQDVLSELGYDLTDM